MATTLGSTDHDIDTMAGLQAAPRSPRRKTRRNSSLVTADMTKPIANPFESASGFSQDRKLARKRAARACDQCRRRKSRCDGQQNCSACQVIGLQCGYGERIKQSRGPSYVAHLEKKVEELQGQVSGLSDGSGIDTGGPHTQSPRVGASTANSSPTVLEFASLPTMPSLPTDSWNLSMPDTMMPTAAAASDQQPYISTITRNEPRGKPYGIDILRQLWNFCNRIISPPVASRDESSIKLVQALDSLLPVDSIPVPGGPPLLPPKASLIYWLDVAFAEAFVLWPFADRASLDKIMYRVYNTSSFGQDENDRDELALLYAVLALGQRFDVATATSAAERRTQGLSYFIAAKAMVPLATCDRSTTAVQTVLCLALYLKAGSAITRVHAYVSAAASAALRMGMHERTPCFSESDRAIRQRLWSTIYVLNVYVSASLGIPQTLPAGDEDGDPFASLLSAESVEDAKACASHFQLIRLFDASIEKGYRSGEARTLLENGSFCVPAHAIQTTVEELDSWGQSHITGPMENMSKSQVLLAYSYAFIQLVLYSPFVHHLAQPSTNPESKERLYGSRCVRAAAQAIQTAEVLHKRMQLNEAYFNAIDVLAFASMTLLVVELGSADAPLLGEAIRYGKRAKELLLFLSLQSGSAADCWQALSVCWDTNKQLPTDHFANVSPRTQLLRPAPERRAPERPRPTLAHFPDSAIDMPDMEWSNSPVLQQKGPPPPRMVNGKILSLGGT